MSNNLFLDKLDSAALECLQDISEFRNFNFKELLNDSLNCQYFPDLTIEHLLVDLAEQKAKQIIPVNLSIPHYLEIISEHYPESIMKNDRTIRITNTIIFRTEMGGELYADNAIMQLAQQIYAKRIRAIAKRQWRKLLELLKDVPNEKLVEAAMKLIEERAVI